MANRLLIMNRTLINLDPNARPVLFQINQLTLSMRISSLQTRTGNVNPPLSVLGDPRAQIPQAPEALRTTAEGMRLEITPSATMLRAPPENQRPVVAPPTSRPESIAIAAGTRAGELKTAQQVTPCLGI